MRCGVTIRERFLSWDRKIRTCGRRQGTPLGQLLRLAPVAQHLPPNLQYEYELSFLIQSHGRVTGVGPVAVIPLILRYPELRREGCADCVGISAQFSGKREAVYEQENITSTRLACRIEEEILVGTNWEKLS